MEEKRGGIMVDDFTGIRDNASGSKKEANEASVKWCSIPLSEMVKQGKRLEASVFDIEARRARDLIKENKYGYNVLLGKDGIIDTAYYPERFKRIYCDKENGEPFYLPSQMTDIYPRTDKYISRVTKCDIDELRLKEKTLLLTRSGTIGNISLVSKTLQGTIYSDDVIRVTFKKDYDLGYTYAYLKSQIGNTVLQTNGYGSVITHLEPEHLSGTLIPNAPIEIKKKIHRLMTQSFELRDKSNELIDQARDLLIKELHLPPISEIQADTFDKNKDLQTFNVKLSKMEGRVDASYHVPIVDSIVELLKKNAEEVTTVGDERISSDVVLPARFKRVYVEKNYGVRFIGGKEMHQLNPTTAKYLSKKVHKKQLEGALGVKPYSLLTPARGSLGDVEFPCKHFHSWAISDNVMQILSNKDICGYLYIFLNSEYGRTLIQRFTYGGVVDAIEPFHIQSVEVPILRNKDLQKQINELALQANEQRYQAYLREQEARQVLDDEVIYAK